MKKIYVITGTYNEFKVWCLQKSICTHSPLLQYIPEGKGPELLRGLRNPEIVCEGSYRNRKDFSKLESLVRAAAVPEIQIVYVERPEKSKEFLEFTGEFVRRIAWRTSVA